MVFWNLLHSFKNLHKTSNLHTKCELLTWNDHYKQTLLTANFTLFKRSSIISIYWSVHCVLLTGDFIEIHPSCQPFWRDQVPIFLASYLWRTEPANANYKNTFHFRDTIIVLLKGTITSRCICIRTKNSQRLHACCSDTRGFKYRLYFIATWFKITFVNISKDQKSWQNEESLNKTLNFGILLNFRLLLNSTQICFENKKDTIGCIFLFWKR